MTKIAKHHRDCSIRLPFKLDLRDYATWLGRSDPFSAEDAIVPSTEWDRSLEALLAHQVRHNSGGIEFTVADLHAVARISAMLVVLDGFDEVADVEKRNLVVEEIQKAVARLEVSSASLQVIITSRPAAFANSPGFPEASFPHFELQSLTMSQINEYAAKWMDARHLIGRDRKEFSKTLREKVSQPHMRDLARNPMQLAILLSLIQTRGTSLPDKRTALYDSYMDTFFSREAEKSIVVREHRDLLISLHQYLAWILHTQSESGQNRGSVSKDQLEQLVRAYLAREGHSSEIAEQLFVGIIERVVALVSRVQGTFEFEVQPLREYFAARFLYETAPYSPPGAERRGTKPDRFDAAARNFYWLNVTRFYAGCFSKGELASLVGSLEMLLVDKDFEDTAYPLTLATMLLADWVFSQQPRLVQKVGDLILTRQGMRTLIASTLDRRPIGGISLPPKCGSASVLRFALSELNQDLAPDYRTGLAQIAAQNSDRDEIQEILFKKICDSTRDERLKWLKSSHEMGILRIFTLEQLNCFCAESPFGTKEMDLLIETGRLDFFEQTEDLFQSAIQILLDGSSTPHVHVGRRSQLGLLTEALESTGYLAVIGGSGSDTVSLSVARRHYHKEPPAKHEEETTLNSDAQVGDSRLVQILEFYVEASKRPVNDWSHDLGLWNGLVEPIRQIWGDRWSLFRIAHVASALDIDPITVSGCDYLLDADIPLCSRAAHVRAPQPPSWWRDQLDAATQETEIAFVISLLFAQAEISIMIEIFDLLDRKINTLSVELWARFYRALPELMWIWHRGQPKRLAKISAAALPVAMSPRFAACILAMQLRAPDKNIYRRYLSKYDGNDAIILERLQWEVLQWARRGKIPWKEALEIAKSSYGKKIAVDFGPYILSRYTEKPRTMSLELARRVCASSEQYPLAVLGMAEQVISTHVRKAVRPVAAIAEEEHWF
jgi:hypothetical protein